MNRFANSILVTLLLVLAQTTFATDQQANNPTGAGVVPDHIVLTWTADSHTTRTITWRTAAAVARRACASNREGTIYVVTGRSGNKSYPDLSSKVWDSYFFDPQDQPSYMVATVKAEVLTLKTVKQDGTIVDPFAIDKSKDTDTDILRAPIPSVSWVKYAAPTLVVYGNVVSPNMVRHSPLLKDGSWYVDLYAFAASLGRTASTRNTGTRLAGRTGLWRRTIS